MAEQSRKTYQEELLQTCCKIAEEVRVNIQDDEKLRPLWSEFFLIKLKSNEQERFAETLRSVYKIQSSLRAEIEFNKKTKRSIDFVYVRVAY